MVATDDSHAHHVDDAQDPAQTPGKALGARAFAGMYRLPALSSASVRLLQQVQHIMLQSTPGILSMIQVKTMDTLPSQAIPQSGGTETLDRSSFELELTVMFKDVVAGNYGALLEQVYEAVPEAAKKLEAELLMQVGKVTEATGNVVDGGGQPVNIDLILDMIEKTEISFEPDGSIGKGFAFVTSPELADKLGKLQPTPEQLRRREDIINRKREVWFARRTARRVR